MPHTAAQRARGSPKERHKAIPPKKPAPQHQRAGLISAAKRGERVILDPSRVPPAVAAAVVASVADFIPASHIDAKRVESLTLAAEASPRIVQAMVDVALDLTHKVKERIAASRLVLAVAGLVDGQAAARAGAEDGDPRDLDAGGLRRLALGAQARLSALEAVAQAGELAPTNRTSDATSDAQQAQVTDSPALSGSQAAPDQQETSGEAVHPTSGEVPAAQADRQQVGELGAPQPFE